MIVICAARNMAIATSIQFKQFIASEVCLTTRLQWQVPEAGPSLS